MSRGRSDERAREGLAEGGATRERGRGERRSASDKREEESHDILVQNFNDKL